jgi:hypothetical protein
VNTSSTNCRAVWSSSGGIWRNENTALDKSAIVEVLRRQGGPMRSATKAEERNDYRLF